MNTAKKSLEQWAKLGVARVRRDIWANPKDYVLIDLLSDGMRGPWLHLYSPMQKLIGEPTPQDILWLNGTAEEWEEYTGPRHEKDTAP